MNFKVGQRVRITRASSRHFGKEASILAIWHGPINYHITGRRGSIGYHVDVDGVGRYANSGGEIGYPAEDLAPLTDPKADAFMERIKKLKPYDEPKRIGTRDPAPLADYLRRLP